MNRWALVASEAKAVLADTTAHAIGRAVTARRRSTRILWSVTFVLATVGFSLHLRSLSSHYLQYPISTNIWYKSQEFRFPDVTICNQLPLSLHKLEQKDPNFDELMRISKLPDAQREEELRKLMEGTENDKYSMILSCKYNNLPCGPENFTEYADPMYRRCFTFSPQQEITSNSEEMGLDLLVFAENNHGHSPLQDLGPAVPRTWERSGIRLVIHERGTPAHPELKGVNVQTGVNAQFAVSMEMFRLLEIFKNGEWRCDGDERMVAYCEPDVNGTSPFYKETTEDCYTGVLQRLAFDTCGCFSPEYDILNEMCVNRVINSSTDVCDVDSPCYKQFKSSLIGNYETLVVSKCKPTCHQISYSKQISTSDWPSHIAEKRILKAISDRYLDLLGRGVLTSLAEVVNASETLSDGAEILRNNFLKLTVYPDSMTADMIVEELAYPFVSFISEVGGILGLWMGASILTFLEPLQFFLSLACIGKERVSDRNAKRSPATKNVELHLTIDSAE